MTEAIQTEGSVALEAPERHIYALMAYSANSGAASTFVGAIGLEKSDDAWKDHVVLAPSIADGADGGWWARIEDAKAAEGIDPEVIAYWQERGNAIVWDIIEIPPTEYASASSLEEACDALVEDVLMNPDPDPMFLTWATGAA
jgi:hypothetical protein